MITDRKVYNKITKLINYLSNQKYVTLNFLLPSGAGATFDLTGVVGTIKSAFIRVTGLKEATATSADGNYLRFSFTLNGSALASNVQLGYADGDEAQGWISNGGSNIYLLDVSTDLDLNASNTYTLSFDNSGSATGTINLYSSNCELVVTFEPSGL